MIRHPVVNGSIPAAALVACLLVMAAPAAAQDSLARPSATVNVSSSGVDFRPEADYARAVVTVSNGGEVFRYSFASDEYPSISVFDSNGETLADGVYQWELLLLPTLGERRQLMVETTKNGGETPTPIEPLFGSFAVVDGFIADPELKEGVPDRPADDEAGVDFLSSEPRALGGEGAADRTGDDSDDVAELCEARASLRSASCEADVQAVLASEENMTVDPLAGGLVAPDRKGNGDSDADVAASGLAAAEFVFTQSDEAVEAAPARRSVDPEGANGRPRSEGEQQ